MTTASCLFPIVGRETELATIGAALTAADAGDGRVILLAGEAGVGKTLLTRAALAHTERLVLSATSSAGATIPFGPVVAMLRNYLQHNPFGLYHSGSLAGHLGLLMPELGPPPTVSDQPTVFEAIRQTFAVIAERCAVVLLFDDLHWADAATLELLPVLANGLDATRVQIVGTYRNDELPRGNGLRRLRTELRRQGRLHEVTIGPLEPDESFALIAHLLNAPPCPELATLIHNRAQGLPFVIEELTIGLRETNRLRTEPSGIALADGETMPIPNTIRDAILLRIDELSEAARRAIDTAAVVGMQVDLGLVIDLTGDDDGLTELLQRGLIVEEAPGFGSFRHALTHEVVYAQVPWTRRRALHRHIATALEATGTTSCCLAEHWLAGHDLQRAREALVADAERAFAVHAYRDGVEAARKALEIWPNETDEPARLAVLDRLGLGAQCIGDFVVASHAWDEATAGYRRLGETLAFAQAERQLAGVLELQGAWERSLNARQAAAEAFVAAGLSADAAVERLVTAAHFNSSGQFEAALPVLALAEQEAVDAGRADLQARAIALDGALRSKLGDATTGLSRARSGLALALAQNIPSVAAEAYKHMATALEHAEIYPEAAETFHHAHVVCEEHGYAAAGHVCMVCFANLQWQAGHWTEATAAFREIRASSDAPPLMRAISTWLLGTIAVAKGEGKRARALLLEAQASAQQFSYSNMDVATHWWLARLNSLEGNDEGAVTNINDALARWSRTNERHYIIPELRWGATFFAQRRSRNDLGNCTNALADIAAATGCHEALSALAYAIGESTWSDGDAAGAALHFGRSIDFLRHLNLPYELAQLKVRSGLALIAAGQRELGIEHLTDAYRAAKKLGARPLADCVARELEQIGEPVDRRLGKRAARTVAVGGLSRRELEIVRHVGLGQTNREIAQELFLSERTVEMHIGNLLTKLDCRTRVEAAKKAADLGLLLPTG